ncbi:hypothetical protein M0R45_001590 [Rubus argutus]|uniref:Uncharacterized protein n=1 Tax=Rubus argutus TaxID=59490 RepID=A0AAW1VG95_RUBAR
MPTTCLCPIRFGLLLDPHLLTTLQFLSLSSTPETTQPRRPNHLAATAVLSTTVDPCCCQSSEHPPVLLRHQAPLSAPVSSP